MSKAKYDALPAAYQKAIVDSARRAAVYHRQLNKNEEGTIIESLKKAGMTVTENFDKAAFEKIVYQPVRASYAEKFGTDVLSAIEAEK